MNDRLQSLLSQKMILLQIGVGLVLIIIIFVIILQIFQGGHIPTPQDIPTPTPFQPLPENTSVFPKPQSRDVSLFQSIEIVFPRTLSENEKKSVKVTVTPKVELIQTWSDDLKILTLTPQQPLRNDQKYVVSVTSPVLTYVWPFKTVNVEDTSIEDQIRIQSEGDKEYGERIEEMHTEYPWLNDLPLQTKEYFVYFDTKTKTFTGKLYATPNTTERRDQLKVTVQNELTRLRIPFSEYKFIWQENP